MLCNFRLKYLLTSFSLILCLQGYSVKVNAIDSIVLTDPNEVTPVEFNFFNIKEVFNTAVLYWSTMTDVKDNIMIVEKSLDGKSYEELGRVKGTDSRNYNFVDNKPNSTINYYRLTFIYPDKTTFVSPVKVLVKEMNSPFSVYPNLVKSNLTVQTRKDLFKETIVHIIYVNTGEVVFQTALFSGNYQKDINVSTLAPGSYVAEVQYGTHVFHYTFNKQ